MTWLLLAQNAGNAGDVFVGFGIMSIFMLILSIAALGVWIWALVDAIQNPRLDGTMRLVWVLVIVFTNLIGALVYLAIGRSRRTSSGA